MLCDTCFLIHTRELCEIGKIDFRPILSQFRLGITDYLLTEFEHFEVLDFFQANQFNKVPISESDILKFLHSHPFLDNLDRADQSLLLEAKNTSNIILSDDGELILEARALNIDCYMLPQFGLSLVRNSLISKNILSKALKFWENVHRYALKDLKNWSRELQEIR
jgi:hypothetical protein